MRGSLVRALTCWGGTAAQGTRDPPPPFVLKALSTCGLDTLLCQESTGWKQTESHVEIPLIFPILPTVSKQSFLTFLKWK